MEKLFETTVALAEAGATNRKGMPKPVPLALFVRRFRREVRAPFPPAPIVHAMLAPLAWIGSRGEQGAAHRRAGRCLTASNAEPGTRLSWSRSSSSQRLSAVPLTNQGEPLSATMRP